MARGTGANATRLHTASRGARSLAAPAEPVAVARKPRGRQPRPLSSADEQQIATAYAYGASIGALARQYRVANKRVAAVVAAHGGTVRRANRPPRPLSSADEQRIAAAYAADVSIGALARQYRVANKRIVAIVTAQGLKRHGRGGRPLPLPAETIVEIVRAYEHERRNTVEIAAQHGISDSRVSRALVEAGVELRRYVLNTPVQLGVEQRAALAAAYVVGAPTDELKRRFRCGSATVHAVLAEHGVTIRPRRARTLPVRGTSA